MKSRITVMLLCLFACTVAQAQVANPGFEKGSPGEAPPGWFVPQPVLDAGYVARISSDNPKEGKQCAYITFNGGSGNGFGNMMQAIDAVPYRGKRVRLRAAVRFEAGSGFGRTQLWLRVDRVGGAQGFFNNMGDRPITSPEWAFYDIVGTIDSDAESINFGMLMVGTGRAWIDAVSLGEDTGPVTSATPARALTDRGLENLVAYTKLLGYVRHFHPSNAVEKADWNAFAIAGIPVAEEAKDPADLANRLENFFKPIAPTVHVFVTGRRPKTMLLPTLPSDAANCQIATWENIGFGGGSTPKNPNVYRSRRIFTSAPGGTAPAGLPDPRSPFEADLGGGVSCVVPLALFANNDSALPHTVDPTTISLPAVEVSGDDRTTRLGDVALAWNVYEHFYPYLDVVKADWPAVLRQSLKEAAADPDRHAFLMTLRRMAGAAKDGHGFVGMSDMQDFAMPPIACEWIEGRMIVTRVGTGITSPKPGDEITKIDGKAMADLWKEQEPMLAGATDQWRRFRSQTSIFTGANGSDIALDAVNRAGDSYSVTLKRSIGAVPDETRPQSISQIKPGIWYVNLDGPSIKMEDYRKAIPDLAKAKGIVFDMRGYPNEVAQDVVSRISDKPVTSAFWNTPKVTKPDQQGIEFIQSRWNPSGPLEPRFKGKIAFVTDGRAISFAESIMGMVEYYKLGEIVGEATAGTNGNINPFSLPGGYTMIFTGMKVVKHDGTTHHGVGIQPTVAVHRSVAGVRTGKDELLDKAIEIVSRD